MGLGKRGGRGSSKFEYKFSFFKELIITLVYVCIFLYSNIMDSYNYASLVFRAKVSSLRHGCVPHSLLSNQSIINKNETHNSMLTIT